MATTSSLLVNECSTTTSKFCRSPSAMRSSASATRSQQRSYGNARNNILDGGDDADQLNGLGGNDTFVFQAGQAPGDTVYEFAGNGAGAGDVL